MFTFIQANNNPGPVHHRILSWYRSQTRLLESRTDCRVYNKVSSQIKTLTNQKRTTKVILWELNLDRIMVQMSKNLKRTYLKYCLDKEVDARFNFHSSEAERRKQLLRNVMNIYESQNEKIHKIALVSSENSEQPEHPPILPGAYTTLLFIVVSRLI